MESIQQNLLQRLADGRFHSGQELGEQMGLTRAAVWKYIRELRGLGLAVQSVRGRGYRVAGGLSLLDESAIHQALPENSRQRIGCVEVFTSLPSTSSYLKDKPVRPGQVAVCLAETQTQGRGRRGRHWVSPFAANIYASIKLQLSLEQNIYGSLSLLIGVAICRLLKEVGIQDASVKWPNDVFVNNAKLAGVLIEFNGEANGPVNAVIGMGLNVRMPPSAGEQIDQDWIDLDSLIPGVARHRNRVCARLVDTVLSVLEQSEQGGVAEILTEWRELDMLFDREVVLQLPNRQISGRAAGINAQGHLLIEQSEGQLVAFASGEVSVRVAS